MKRLFAALAFAGVCGTVVAQSSVTIYGTVDLSGKYVKNEGSSRRLSLSQDGLNSSQLVFTGKEDLGSGLYAGFHLNAGVNADTGTSNTKFFNRRSTVSLGGGFGEIRLGRDYVPTFWNLGIFDAFGIVGAGSTANVYQLLTTTLVRADNAVGYFLPPNLGGIYGQAMVAAGELGQPGNNGRYAGARLGYAAGPLDIAVHAGQQRNAVGFPLLGNNQDTYSIGAAYNFGVAKLMGYVDRESATRLKELRASISVVVPLGQSEIHAGYDRSKLQNTVVPGAAFDNVVWQVKAGYVYNLSKRTALYGTASSLKNGNRSSLSIAGGTAIAAPPILGGSSKGFEAGLRHFF